jgi:hypothetical protein
MEGGGQSQVCQEAKEEGGQALGDGAVVRPSVLGEQLSLEEKGADDLGQKRM